MAQRKVNIGETYIDSLNELKALYSEEKKVKVCQQRTVELAITETLERKKKKK
jgi:DNA-binding LytR/AlgR family response regulator